MIDLTRVPQEDASAVYAIGDIHGRLDLLDRLESVIALDIARSKTARPLVCYLGDYVDRGPQSAQVIERLCSSSYTNRERRFLKGNHEDRLLDFLVDPVRHGPAWVQYGGREALESYGLAVPPEPAESDWLTLRDQFDYALPQNHRAFLSSLRLAVRWRGYLMVHGGLDPALPTTAQREHDLMWIRGPFLDADRDWGFKVVHGHVITAEPVFRPNRIGIDTGAYESGRLTCLVLEGTGERLLQT